MNKGADEKIVVNNTVLRMALAYMLTNFAEDINLDILAATTGASKFDLCRLFKRQFNISPMKFLWTFRVVLAAELIKKAHHQSLTDIAFACGFKSSAHFSRAFRKIYHSTPYSFKCRSRMENPGEPTASYDQLYTNNQQLVATAMAKTLGNH